MRGCECKKKCVACSGFKPLHSAYKTERLRLEEKRQVTLTGPYAERLREWVEEDPRNAETVELVLELLTK
jgi:hypothetical protein